MAKWMPFRSRPGIGRSRGLVAPQHSTIASDSRRMSVAGMSTPTAVLVTNVMPSWASKSTRRCTMFLSSFMFGMPYISSPPMRSARSYTVTRCPARFNCAAHDNPAGPEPITATRLPVRVEGGCGVTQPSSNPRSMIWHSMFLIVTGGSVMPSTQDPSHGAGHTRPVNSGKLLVLCRRSSASRHKPR